MDDLCFADMDQFAESSRVFLQAFVHLSPRRDGKSATQEVAHQDLRWEPATRGMPVGDASTAAFQMHPLIQVPFNLAICVTPPVGSDCYFNFLRAE